MKLEVEHIVGIILISTLAIIGFVAYSELRAKTEQEMVKAGLIQKIEGGTVIWTKP